MTVSLVVFVDSSEHLCRTGKRDAIYVALPGEQLSTPPICYFQPAIKFSYYSNKGESFLKYNIFIKYQMKNVSFSWSWPNTRDIISKQNTLLEKDKHYAHACDIENVQSVSEEHYNTIVLLALLL